MIAGPTQALVLSGGGGNASYEVGVLKGLAAGVSAATGYVPLDPAVLSGSSAGAFNAAVIASWPEASLLSIVQHLEDIWLNYVAETPSSCGNGIYRIRGAPRPYFDPQCWSAHPGEETAILEDLEVVTTETVDRLAYLSGRGLTLGAEILQFLDLGVFMSPERYQRLLAWALRPEAIRHSSTLLTVAVTSWTSGNVHYFANPDMTDENAGLIIAASSALPGFFNPVEVNGHFYVDGGVVMDTPLRPAIRGGADVLHVIYQDPNPNTIPIETMRSLAGAFDRLYVILKARVLNQDIEAAMRINEQLPILNRPGREPYRKLTIHRYYPKGDIGGVAGILNFQATRLEALIELGFQDAAHHDCQDAGCVLPDVK